MCTCTELYFTIFVILIIKWLQAIIIGLIIDIIMSLGSFFFEKQQCVLMICAVQNVSDWGHYKQC